MIAVPWLVFIGVIAGVIFLNLLLVKYFNHPQKAEILPTTVAILSLSLSLLSVLIIPVDIYSVTDTGEIGPLMAVRTFYYILYISIMVFAFLIIPFAYFHYDAYDPDRSAGTRFVIAFKYSIGFVIFIAILFVLGFVIKPVVSSSVDVSLRSWAEEIFLDTNKGAGAINFVISCLTLLGYLCWITFTAYGLSALPIGMIRGKKSTYEEKNLYKEETIATRAKWKHLLAEGKDHKVKERANDLKDKERTLTTRFNRLEKETGGWRKIFIVLRPFAIIFGLIFLAFTILIMVSIILSSIDKILQTYCSSKCGFILLRSQFTNPIDQLLVILSRFFPMDYVLIGIIVIYFYFCTISGISEIGIRILILKLFSFKKGGTTPQGLLCASFILILSVLALNNQFVTLAPQYATFGSQKQLTDNGTVACEIEYLEPNGTCRMTVIAEMVNRINVGINFFGIAFYWMTWAFIGFFLIGFIVAIARKKASNIEELSDDELEEIRPEKQIRERKKKPRI
eukprot:TRINITY_DN9535_c0_g1_i2.p1 TRINITY_DN9535_c0_g1~~TRINITY_DN9535_c0_g1_i2.p1  ORF type:complete len:509 (-),score=58.37 TRINITY_DN9535_c0_g1_i2:38-1564(-)